MKISRNHYKRMKVKTQIFGSALKKYGLASFERKSLSELEDSDDAVNILGRIGREAGINAARQAKAAGLTRVYVRNNELEKISASGRRKVISQKNKRVYFVKYKPDTILHVAKK